MDEYPEQASKCKARLSDRAQKRLVVLVLIFYGQAISVCCSIRYGFLADSFASRNISGKVYGFVGSSLFIGYGAIFFSGLTERAMKRTNSRNLLAGIMAGYFVLQLVTGFAYQFHDNVVVITISFLMRILQGVLAYPGYLVPLDFINANFQSKFDFVNGLLNMGYFTGHGLAEVIGCIIYDNFGYEVAYAFSAAIALLSVGLTLFIIPKSRTYLSTQKDTSSEVVEKTFSHKSRLTRFLIIPMMATMCINANYGVLQVAVTPFLKEEFNKSISYGGTVLMLVSLGMGAGGFIAGILLQKKILNTFTIMALGALSVCLGLLMTFPPEFLPAMYNIAPIIAFPGVFLAGFGDPLITIATLRALYDMQLQKRGVLPPKVATRITGIWLIGYCSLYYMGSFIAGFLKDYLSYSVMAEILAGFCLLSTLTCVGMRLLFNERTGPNDEETPYDTIEKQKDPDQAKNKEGTVGRTRRRKLEKDAITEGCLVVENQYVTLDEGKKTTEVNNKKAKIEDKEKILNADKQEDLPIEDACGAGPR